MIKGINKQVLEIFETDSTYFEKALFFVKPEYSGYSENKLREIAQNELKHSGTPPMTGKRSGKIKLRSLLIGASIFISGILTGIIFSFII